MLCNVGDDTSIATCLTITDIILSFFGFGSQMQPNFEALRLQARSWQVWSSQMKKKKRIGIEYPIPDLTYPILELDLMLDSQP